MGAGEGIVIKGTCPGGGTLKVTFPVSGGIVRGHVLYR